MRRKITDSPKIDTTDLPDLTAQQQAFVRGLLDGKTASDAYRAAYDCSAMQPNSIWVAASRLRSDANVALWLAQARKAQLGHANVTLSQHVQRLDELKQLAIETGNLGAAVQAEQLIGKATGHYVERLDLNIHNPDALMDEIAALSPEVARALSSESPTEH